MARTEVINNQSGDHAGYMINCPGCDKYHVIDDRWAFDGDFEYPTFSPSLMINRDLHKRDPKHIQCHSFIHKGKIEYLNDCSHSMAGQTIDLPEVED